METNIHIVYPQTGVEFSQLKKIFATFEEGCKLFNDTDSIIKEGKVLRVESGSIWLKVILPVAKTVFPFFLEFIAKKLCSKRNKRRIQVEVEDNGKIIRINIEE